MVKIAVCGYGHDGRSYDETGRGYTYIVNDNVNVGDAIQVIATSRKGNKFVTTASPVETHRENSIQGQLAKSMAEEEIKEKMVRKEIETGEKADFSKVEINQSYTGKELGATGFRGSNQYTQSVRARQMQVYMQDHPNATMSKNASDLVDSYGTKNPIQVKSKYQSFDEYSKPFNK